ncbi:broad substrate specificity ATP-binding cassette transporter ABCG2-like [Halichondria panicea]|uniref:broad substrate specificity ATP-binding cassette transporter ABCG2-like n=1 Tax=Halichondria panicea TaxID=6063 RepID=UPI00312BCB32
MSSKSPYYSSLEQEQSTAMDFHHSTSIQSSSDSSYDGINAEASLAFCDILYTIPTGWPWAKSNKVILNSVSGVMSPGLNAILGPTGSGKTTLLDILADRKSSSRVSGSVLVNGRLREDNFRFKTGYVVQDDIVTGSLTVKENFMFSAALRLPSSTSWAQREERVATVIQELGLERCANQKIGTEFFRGVSGGERKRTNIGMELIIEPQVLFLDEPTTGLDAYTAVSVVQLLKRLGSTGNRVVVMSIHQPRYSIFKLFDTLTMLSLGNTVFHGPAHQALPYFNRLGYECEEHDNPADYFLDIINRCELTLKDEKTESTPLLGAPHSAPTDLASEYLGSPECQSVRSSLGPIVEGMVGTKRANGGPLGSLLSIDNYATNFFWQCVVVGFRAAVKIWRNPLTIVMQTLVMVIFALIVGGIYFQLASTPSGMMDRLGVIFFIVMSQVFGNLGAIELFIKERAAFLHESSSGYYRVSVYFLSKSVTDLMIMRMIPLTVFSAITYFMIGFQYDAAKFGVFYLTLALTSMAGAALAFTCSAMVSVFAVANLLVSLIFILYMLFGGFLIGLSSIPDWISWMKYLSIFRYSIEAISVNELQDQWYSEKLGPNGTCPYEVKNATCYADGNLVLKYRGYSLDWLWYDQIALAGTTLGWLILAYIVLRIVKIYYRHFK